MIAQKQAKFRIISVMELNKVLRKNEGGKPKL